MMLAILLKYFLLFIIYSFIGWFIEVVAMLFNTGKVIDRGFLIGPYCPIYGGAGVLMTIFLSKYQNNIMLLFIMSIIICGSLEYFVSYVLEKIFKARWWDYSEKKFNLNGRICVNTLIPFGILGVLLIMFINPLLFKFLNFIPYGLRLIIGIVLCIVFTIDVVVSVTITFNLRGTIKKIALDNTEEITERVKKIIHERSIIHRRLVKAFPNLKVRIK